MAAFGYNYRPIYFLYRKKTAYSQSINQSKHISIAPYVASESEAQSLFDVDI